MFTTTCTLKLIEHLSSLAAALSAEDLAHPLEFNAEKHKILNSELKQLYTAITRARVNVWIYDQDVQSRKPMFEYFKALHLVKSHGVTQGAHARLIPRTKTNLINFVDFFTVHRALPLD